MPIIGREMRRFVHHQYVGHMEKASHLSPPAASSSEADCFPIETVNDEVAK